MVSIPLDDRLALYIVAVTDYTPAYAEDYAANRRRLAQILRLMDVRESSTPASDPFSLEALAGRVGYVAEEREAEQPEEELPEPERGERPADAPEAGQGEAAPTEEATP